MNNISIDHQSEYARKRDMDIAKGIGILLVVWAHAQGPLTGYIVQFHMPFFFFISGMLYVHGDRSIRQYCGKKLSSLLIPFYWWNLLLYPLFFFLYYKPDYSAATFIREIAEICLTLNKVPFLGATWFLASLFWISILIHILVTAFGKYRWCDILLILLGIGTAALGFYITLPYKQSRTLICLLFYVAGYLYKKYLDPHIRKIVGYITGICAFAAYILIANNNAVNMSTNYYQNKLLFIAGALLISYAIIMFSRILDDTIAGTLPVRHLAYLGMYSFDIMIWHFLTSRLAIVLQIIAGMATYKDLSAFPVYDVSGLWWLVYALTSLYGALAWKYVLEHNPLTWSMRRLHMIR